MRQRILQLDGLADDERTQLLELVDTKKYGLVWEDKPDEVEERLRRNLPVLDEVKERRIANSPDAPNHVIIEGDNLEALNVLNYTHEGRIDVIYIDPPYNTGNRDFVYNDHIVNPDDDYRHSKWLSFMSKRLRLAKRLLSDKGVIFISIDNNELAQLKLLCDEIMGAGSFVECFIWNKTSTPPALSYKSRKTHEFILCYTKRNNNDKFVGMINEGGDAPIYNEVNKENILHFPSNYVKTTLADGEYIAGPRDKIELLDNVTVKNGVIISDFSLKGHFRWSQTTLDKELADECMFIVKSNRFSIRYCRKGDRTVPPPNFITERFYDTSIDKVNQNVDTNEQAGKELIDIFGFKPFDFPKPTSLISYLLSFNNHKSSTVLDFFAGSGTTLHAVMQLNKQDGGNRQCILVTNNENGICENVTYERNHRVINGYTTPRGVQVEGLSDNNLRYFRTRLLPRRRTNRNMRSLMAAATDLLCLKENIWNETVIDNAKPKIAPRDARLFADGDRRMLVIYNEEAIARIVEWIDTYTAGNDTRSPRLKVYTFSYSGYAFDEDFGQVADRVQLCALPAAIYEAYRRVLPKEDRYYDLEIIDTPETDRKETTL